MAWCNVGLVHDPVCMLLDGETKWAAVEYFGHGD